MLVLWFMLLVLFGIDCWLVEFKDDLVGVGVLYY